MRPEDCNPFTTARLKLKLKRGPKLSRKALATYALNLSLGRFEHHPGHWDKPGEPKSTPQQVPKVILALLELIPVEILCKACAELNHPSFWHDVGPRWRCICGDFNYKD